MRPEAARAWCCMLLCLGAFALPPAAAKSVVVLYGLEWRTHSSRIFDEVLREELGVLRSGNDVQFHSEFVDNAFPGEAQEKILADFLRDRYAGMKVDAIVALGSSALRFMARYRDHIFPGVPLAFAGVRDTTLARIQRPTDFVGSPNRMNALPSVELALRLRPDASELVLVAGATENDRIMEEHLKAAAAAVAPKLRTRVLSGLSFAAIVAEVAKLPKEAIVVTGSFARDATGQSFPAVSLVARLREVSPVPIVHTFETSVGLGALASVSIPVESIPHQAAAVAKQLLEGVPPASVVVPPPAPLVTYVDWRELQRWNIPESRLPPGAVVRFRDVSFWEQYRYQVLGVASAVLLQSALITLLLLQRRRRGAAESMLRRNEETMKLAAEAASLAMWSWDIETDVVSRVPALGPFLGLPGSGKGLDAFLAMVHPEDRQKVSRAVRHALDSGGSYDAEYRVVDAEGKVHWFVGRGSVEHERGKPARLRGITLDITSRRAAELEARHRSNELAHLSRVTMVGKMSGSIAHELNQPLTAILANAQAAQMFIRHEPVDIVELGSILDDIVENDKRAGDIIMSLRKMLRKEDASQVPLAITEVVQEVLRLMRNDLVNREVTVETRLAPDNPLVRGDRTQLQQVLMNLLLNACDAMAHLPRSERVLCVGVEHQGRDVRVEVADRGSGIPEGSLEEIFVPFYTTKPQGLGLGLAVCKTIIASHGGTLRAENNTSRGATFTFVLEAQAGAA